MGKQILMIVVGGILMVFLLLFAYLLLMILTNDPKDSDKALVVTASSDAPRSNAYSRPYVRGGGGGSRFSSSSSGGTSSKTTNYIRMPLVSFLSEVKINELIVLAFELYKLKFSLNIAIPNGWDVTENYDNEDSFISVYEKAKLDPAIIHVMVSNLKERISDKDFLQMIKDKIKRNTSFDIVELKSRAHKSLPKVKEIIARFKSTANGSIYESKGLAWSEGNKALYTGFASEQSVFNHYSAERILAATSAPLSGRIPDAGSISGIASPADFMKEMKSGDVSGSAKEPSRQENKFLFVRRENGARKLCSLEGDNSGFRTDVSIGQFVKETKSNMVMAPIVTNGPTSLLIGGKGSALEEGFVGRFEDSNDAISAHPSVSRDGKLVAMRVERLNDPESIKTGKSNSVFASAKGSTIMVASYDIETGNRNALYFMNEKVMPDDEAAWCPAFSPKEDTVAFADNENIYIHDSMTGEKLRTVKVPANIQVMPSSGLAFSPDGSKLAYLSYVTSYQGDRWVTSYSLVLVSDIDRKEPSFKRLELPETIKPYSPGSVLGLGFVRVDFSPNGKFVVMSCAKNNSSGWWGTGLMESVTQITEFVPTNIYAVDLESKKWYQCTEDGNSYSPAWFGR